MKIFRCIVRLTSTRYQVSVKLDDGAYTTIPAGETVSVTHNRA